MRPSLLNPLFASVTTLSGVGPKLDKLLRRLTGRDDGARVADLLFHLPAGTIDRRARPKLRDVVPGTVATVEVTIDRHRAPPPGRSRAPYLVYASDETGDLVLTYFSAHTDYIEKLLPIGERRYISGMTALYDGMLQMVHPDRVVDEAGLAKLPLVEPVYPLTEGLFASQLRRAIEGAIDRLPALPEWQDPAYLAREGFPSFADALRLVHRPAVPADILPTSPAWSRLAYDELLAGQLALGLMRAHMRRVSGRRTVGDGRLRERIIAALPYSLTASQVRALADIAADLGQPHRMLRLLQGDVGSGKTVVALLACAAVFAGCDEHIVVDRDPSVRIQKGMTWAWRPQPQHQEARTEGGRKVISRDVITPRGDRQQREFPRYEDPQKDMVHQRTRIAIEQTLASKGLTQVSDPGAADFFVDYQVSVESHRGRVAEPVNPPVLVCGYYGCWQSWGYWGPTGYAVRTYHYRTGLIIFDLVRRGEDKLAFRATYEKPLDWNGLDQQHVNSGVKRMLRDLKPQN